MYSRFFAVISAAKMITHGTTKLVDNFILEITGAILWNIDDSLTDTKFGLRFIGPQLCKQF